jgi:hypothetical protein
MAFRSEPITLEQYFSGCDPLSREIFEAIRTAVGAVGPAEMRVTRSQVAFRRRIGFAYAWMPGQYVHVNVAPLVLTVDLGRRDPSPRWKQVVEPRPRLFTHHLELRSAGQVDDEVTGWLREAWERAAWIGRG